jgi:protein-L-isoaspartate(D-aspartate) O-methyltransferase
MMADSDFTAMREAMIREQLQPRGIENPRVLQAMRTVARDAFVPPELHRQAYNDAPMPIGQNQTISQPFIVALMTQMLGLQGDEKVLEIGTGCGYQTAILCELADYVYTLERYPQLADKAGATLTNLGYSNLDIHVGDGSQGLPDNQPFDAIIVTAAAPSIPGPLASQLDREGGRLVVPVGNAKQQHLYIVRRYGDRFNVEKTVAVRFVPLIGRYGFKQDPRRNRKRRGDDPSAQTQ